MKFSISQSIFNQFREHAEKEYPAEACGALFTDGSKIVYEPFENMQDKYHKLDPVLYPRTSKDAFLINTLKLSKRIEHYEQSGGSLFAIFHSHIDVGAYFSAEDKKQMTTDNSEEVFPATCYIVTNVVNGAAAENAVFYFDKDKAEFQAAELQVL